MLAETQPVEGDKRGSRTRIPRAKEKKKSKIKKNRAGRIK